MKHNSLLGILFFSFLVKSTFAFDHLHLDFDEILKKYITYDKEQSLVDYKSLKKNDLKLNQYLASLTNVTQKEFNSFNENQKLAFLINAYNAFTIKLIIDNYPLQSIKDIGTIFSNPWKKKFFFLLDKKQNLDHVEHQLIRKSFPREARIHFALVCASISCPNLLPVAFTENNLNSLFLRGIQEFFNDSSKNQFLKSPNRIKISKIFQWYEEDFIRNYNSVIQFISQNTTQQFKELNDKTIIDYFEYNWDLNQISEEGKK